MVKEVYILTKVWEGESEDLVVVTSDPEIAKASIPDRYPAQHREAESYYLYRAEIDGGEPECIGVNGTRYSPQGHHYELDGWRDV